MDMSVTGELVAGQDDETSVDVSRFLQAGILALTQNNKGFEAYHGVPRPGPVLLQR
ncbi:hypothetical protein ACIQNG_33575 [Streptomyces sp. NPDC091377]|uniref:hypothetical protein n=1 Tax=Streptomyces sp. NPDC091377 TaxID=3365995 RepID=UPI00380B031F